MKMALSRADITAAYMALQKDYEAVKEAVNEPERKKDRDERTQAHMDALLETLSERVERFRIACSE